MTDIITVDSLVQLADDLSAGDAAVNSALLTSQLSNASAVTATAYNNGTAQVLVQASEPAEGSYAIMWLQPNGNGTYTLSISTGV